MDPASPAPPGGPVPPAHARAHAFVTDLEAPALAARDRHHLDRVLRLRPGDPLTVSDGRGGWRPCRFGPILDVVGPVLVEPRPEPPLTVAFALVKGDRPEWVVQKLTELGVDRIVPFAAERSVVRWDPSRAERNRVRMLAVAREAAMQSRRCWLPDVDPLTDFAAVAGIAGAALADRHGMPPGLDRPTVLVGPEGGWSPAELEAGLPVVALGPRVLRAETAAVTAGALLSALRASVVAPVAPAP